MANKISQQLKGTGVALVTPFNQDYSIDFEGLKKLEVLKADMNRGRV